MTQSSVCKMPDVLEVEDGGDRRVGIEIELSGISYEALVASVADFFDGNSRLVARYVTEIETRLGSFTVELDSDPIKELDLEDDRLPETIRDIGGQAMGVIDAAAERIVPLEIITPPLAFSQVHEIESLIVELRKAGALGSREAIYYAFGLQLNPELPDLRPSTLLRYLQAFAALYEWLKARHQLDISRKFTTYIEPWSKKFTDLLMNDDYAPDRTQLMRDYLVSNPTRNRALDLLPLFAYLDPELLSEYVDDPRIKSRPTLHYRLPDCDIDNASWGFSSVWNDWVILEQIASNAAELGELRALYRERRKISLHNLTHSWQETITHWLHSKGYV